MMSFALESAAASVEISMLEALVSTTPLALSTLAVCAITLAAKCKSRLDIKYKIH